LVQWLRLRAPSAEDLGLIPGQGTRSSVLPLRPGIANYIYIYIYIYIYDLKGKSFTRPVTIKLSPVSEKKSLIFYYGRKLTFIEDTSMIVFTLALGGFIYVFW